MRSSIFILLAMSLLLVAGCSGKRSGGYYQDDGPPRGDSSDRNIDWQSIPDAIPRIEPYSKTGNRSYTALGKQYYPISSAKGFTERGQASWYGKKFHGNKTSSGEPYDMYAMTAAHKTLPLPSYVRVTNVDNNRVVVVRVNDRGPFLHGRIIDVSYAAAKKLGMVATGTANVFIEVVEPGTTSQTAQAVAYPSTVQSTVLSTTAVAGSVGNNGAGVSQAGIARQAIPSKTLEQSEAALQSAVVVQSSGAAALDAVNGVSKQVNSSASGSSGSADSNSNNNKAIYINGVLTPDTGFRTPKDKSSSKPSVPLSNLQVGAFSVPGNAAKMRARVIADGFNNSRVLKVGGLYKVILGPYSSSDLEAARARLQRSGYAVKKFQDN